ncbi:alpha/beta hydrolase [Elizabethkingia sp. HvH-WGS333]|uniref:DUF4180 domain-containing protein n=1 Tax=Elizabethkingia TaxID=308865 RepID=UPI0007417AA2|nr:MULTISPECIES: DUF4180 domain-containing protein [Elizabethkingia]MDV3957469.1 DUF4180 domain-containing protein [Elizabethkingia anophelis]KUG13684.1 alpha/beta hydrolase [Elizabethkingia miricola]MCL1658231.1 DUF4180 domain-containing protein [Elizabethkingia miricola]MCL1677394.1 DUF4180 domain-containing protein [Elizabethkingia miricola]MCP1252825.1 DUF4180 domain-containing protein [Elizabethkingia sp. S0634]
MYTIKEHTVNGIKVAELNSDKVLIQQIQDGLDLLADLYYLGFDKIIIGEQNIVPDFFDLKNKMAGEILQKFSNYKMKLTIVGSFNYESKSLKDFIYECNKGKLVNFVSTLSEALV